MWPDVEKFCPLHESAIFCVRKHLTFPAVLSHGEKEGAERANGCNGSNKKALGTNMAMMPLGRRVSADIELLNFA